jgi:UDP-N-acetylglucosamine/UDP-N-acetylgalactosamine 4-epimerase
VALGGSTTLAELYQMIRERLAPAGVQAPDVQYGPPRAGDIQHSAADIAAARRVLAFEPELSVAAGLEQAVAWYAAAQR